MPLTQRADGTGEANRVTAVWWNDFYDLLTGVMTDQPVTIASTTATKLTRVGSTGSDTTLLTLQTTVSAAHEYSLQVNTSGNLQLRDVTNNASILRANSSSLTLIPNGGNLVIGSSWATLGSNNLNVAVLRGFGGATAGKQIWIMTGGTDPNAGNGLLEGDLVFKY